MEKPDSPGPLNKKGEASGCNKGLILSGRLAFSYKKRPRGTVQASEPFTSLKKSKLVENIEDPAVSKER